MAFRSVYFTQDQNHGFLNPEAEDGNFILSNVSDSDLSQYLYTSPNVRVGDIKYLLGSSLGSDADFMVFLPKGAKHIEIGIFSQNSNSQITKCRISSSTAFGNCIQNTGQFSTNSEETSSYLRFFLNGGCLSLNSIATIHLYNIPQTLSNSLDCWLFIKIDETQGPNPDLKLDCKMILDKNYFRESASTAESECIQLNSNFSDASVLNCKKLYAKLGAYIWKNNPSVPVGSSYQVGYYDPLLGITNIQQSGGNLVAIALSNFLKRYLRQGFVLLGNPIDQCTTDDIYDMDSRIKYVFTWDTSQREYSKHIKGSPKRLTRGEGFWVYVE